MDSINKDEVVKNQYDNSNRLSTRIMLHKKYSTNKIGFSNWIYSNYNFVPNINILELGCGTGEIWKKRINSLLPGIKLYLTDYSDGMVNSVMDSFSGYRNVFFKTVNIENIPYNDEKFNIVIANMMLYHVSNISKALSEVRRVLEDDGFFYCATYGENRIVDYVADLLEIKIEKGNKVFTLQNGIEILKPYFSSVKRLDYVDSLKITNIDDLLDYLYSLDGMSSITNIERKKLKKLLEDKMVDGIIEISKEYGMFICKK